MICKFTSPISNKTRKYIIVGNEPEVNCLKLLDKDGIIRSFGYDWFDNLNLKRNEDRDREQEQFAEDYDFDYCDDDLFDE